MALLRDLTSRIRYLRQFISCCGDVVSRRLVSNRVQRSVTTTPTYLSKTAYCNQNYNRSLYTSTSHSYIGVTDLSVCTIQGWYSCVRTYSSSSSKSTSNDGEDKSNQLSAEAADDFASEIRKELRQIAENQRQSKEQVENDIPKETDFVVIGGGSFGLSVAYWLKKRHPDGFTLTVIERDPTYSRAATALSVGSIRQQFSLPENIQLSMASFKFLQNVREHLSVLDLDPPDINFNHQGYLLLAADKRGEEILKRNHVTQIELGAKVELMSSNMLKNKFPWLNTDDLLLGSYGLANEGWFDPWLYLSALKIKCMSLGVKFTKGEVIGFNTQDNVCGNLATEGAMERRTELKAVKIKADNGKTYPMRFAVCVNCAGPWSGEVAAMAGIGAEQTGPLSVPLPVEPRKRYVYVFHCPDGPGINMPMLIDPSGAYVRREGLGGHYICGASPKGEDKAATDLDVDYEFFEKDVWPALAHRVPVFNNLKLKSAWAGFYDYNYFDQNLIIGNHPYFRNFMMATGCSGHGVQQSPAIGRALAEYIIDNEYNTIELSRFSFDRLLTNQPIYEEGPYII